MKRILHLAVILVAALLLMVTPNYATDNAIVTGDIISTTAGRDIEYKVSIHGNPGLAGYQLKIKYDTSALSYISCTQGDFSSLGTTTCSEKNGVCSIIWYYTTDVASDGTLFVLRYHVRETVAEGTYPIAISSIARDCINYAEQPISLNCTNGSVTVRPFAPKVYGQICCVKQGNEVLYSVYMEDNPGIASYHIQMTFDPTVLEYADTEPGDQTVQLPSDRFHGNFQKRFYTNAFEAIWFSQNNVTDEGVLFSIRLRVKDIAIGTSPVTVMIVANDTLDEIGQPVHFECTDGSVTVDRKVRIVFEGNRSTTVTISGAKGQIIIAAIFAEDGQQLATAVKGIDERDAELHLASSVDGKRIGICKVMTLDNSFRPVCDVLIDGLAYLCLD